MRVEGQGHWSPAPWRQGEAAGVIHLGPGLCLGMDKRHPSLHCSRPPVLFLGPQEESIGLSHSDDNGRICHFPLPLNGHHAPYTSCHPGWRSVALSSAPTPGGSWPAQKSVDSTTKPCPHDKHSLLRQSRGNGEGGPPTAVCSYCRLQSDITQSFHSPQETRMGPLSWCRAGHKTRATSAPIWKWGKGSDPPR